MNEMIVYRYDEVICAPIDVVFDYLDDDEKIKLWNKIFIENIYEDGEQKNVPGTKFETVINLENKIIRLDSVLTDYAPPYKIEIMSNSKEGKSFTKYRLSRDYHGTRLVIEASIIPSNFFYKMMTKMFGWSARIVNDEQFKNFKSFIENEAEFY